MKPKLHSLFYSSGASTFIRAPSSFTRSFSLRSVSGVTVRHCSWVARKSASISRTMNALEQKGMIERSIDPKHRRNVLVRSTAEGKEIDSALQHEMCRYWDAVFARLPEQDVTELLRIWNEIMDSMEAVVKERADAESEGTE